MLKVLIADDELVSRRLLVHAMQSLGLASVETSNGRMAWEVLQENLDTALLITDMLMPEMDGRELVTRVRADERFLELPIILVSGVVTLKEINDLLLLGVSRFLPKPIDVAMLKDEVSRLIGETAKLTATVAQRGR